MTAFVLFVGVVLGSLLTVGLVAMFRDAASAIDDGLAQLDPDSENERDAEWDSVVRAVEDAPADSEFAGAFGPLTVLGHLPRPETARLYHFPAQRDGGDSA